MPVGGLPSSEDRTLSRTLTVAAFAAALLLPVAASAQGLTRCAGKLSSVAGVRLSEQRIASVEFGGSVGSVGLLDALPDAEVTVAGRGPSCLPVPFSAPAAPNDDHIVFQVLVDGVPAPGPSAFPTVPGVPVVTDPEESDQNDGRMVAHGFLDPVQPGPRRVEPKSAGCCSVSTRTSGVVNAATPTVQQR